MYVPTWRCTFQYNPTTNSLDIISHFAATDGTVQSVSAAGTDSFYFRAKRRKTADMFGT